MPLFKVGKSKNTNSTTVFLMSNSEWLTFYEEQ